MDTPRPEHPRPDRFRDDWMNLNGRWECRFDPGQSGYAQQFFTDVPYDKEIVVPFCIESELSGLGYKDFMPGLWYRRTFRVPDGWKNRRVLLHVGACDYYSSVYVNGVQIGKHRGGYASFSLDVTAHLRDGENTLVFEVLDNLRGGEQPAGKQCTEYHSAGCSYTRVTGIWQTVWLEAVPQSYLGKFRLRPDLDNQRVTITATPAGTPAAGTLEAKVLAEGKPVVQGTARAEGGPVQLTLDISQAVAWKPGQPFLYDVELTLATPAGKDTVKTYFGLRKIHTAGRTVYLNNEPLFMRMVLDQGYYPDGMYTAPSDEALKRDIELSQALGCNGARLHQKVFEPRFLHWADTMGYLVWGELGDWGCNLGNPNAAGNLLSEWLEVLQRDWNHPSIIGWCPLNERNDRRDSPEWIIAYLYSLNKLIDPDRLAIDVSGYIHHPGVPSDLYDVHNYAAPAELAAMSTALTGENWAEAFRNYDGKLKGHPVDTPYDGTRPYFNSECGGIWWNPRSEGGDWGYGGRPASEEEFVTRYRETIRMHNTTPNLAGWCYTQLYDIEQETNGLYYYDRTPKFSPDVMARLRAATVGEA
ncbi:MAG: beta-galactosidase [Phycisphaerae bacterium]|nr:beta-galactosidase [Phycisphaerae bacterium]